MSFGRKLGAKRESGRKIVKERTFLSKGRAYIFVPVPSKSNLDENKQGWSKNFELEG